MAVPELKSQYLKMVPEFSGQPELLPRFIETAEKLVRKFYNRTDESDFQNDYLMDSIRSKITGDAQQNLSSCVISTWTELKTALLNTYADKRDVHTLAIEMCNLKQTSESVFDFHTKIQKMVNLQTSYISSRNMDGADHVKKFVLDLGLRTFLRGLKEPLGSLMRTKNPKSLNEALSILQNDFQIDTTKNPIHNQYQGQNQNQRYVPPPFKRQNNFSKPGPSWNHQPRNSNNSFGQNYNSNNWRTNQNPQLQSNRPQNNVWTRQNNQTLPKQTPMSISTRNTRSSLNNIEPVENYRQVDEHEEEHQQSILQDTVDNQQDFQDQNEGNEQHPEDPENQNFWVGASDVEHY